MTNPPENGAGQARATNNAPLVDLHHVGGGRALYVALARVIVRRELISIGAIADEDGCAEHREAG